MRVFPRRTNATPVGEYVRVGLPDMFLPPIDEVHISVTFTWDIEKAYYLAKQWHGTAGPVLVGGPALGQAGEEFEPGRYLKDGYVITSRGCPNRCWFCSVWRREGDKVRELDIKQGWNILDDNLLACSENHIKDVFKMLKGQREKAQFTGGLEAARLEDWHVSLLVDLKPKQMFFAYDTPDDWEPLVEAGRKFCRAGYGPNTRALRCYVLCGWSKDTLEAAEKRMVDVCKAGFMPMAMLIRDDKGKKPQGWGTFQRQWARPILIAKTYKKLAFNLFK